MNDEKRRLEEDRLGQQPWREWGPYLSERQWGTVREDYSPDGDAWDYFPHDQARSRAYRWGEDGLAGVSDDEQRLCLALALWNGRDPILKERLFGLTNGEGNHGEDVKELYYYLDATPTHSYLKMLYKYPQRAFPYDRAGRGEPPPRPGRSRSSSCSTPASSTTTAISTSSSSTPRRRPDDLLMQVTVHNRGPDDAVLHLLPQLWFRNTWSWKPGADRPRLSAAGAKAVEARHAELGTYTLHVEDDAGAAVLRQRNQRRPAVRRQRRKGYFKDAFHDYVVHGDRAAVNPRREGTKAARITSARSPPAASVRVRLRLAKSAAADPFGDFDEVLERGASEADDSTPTSSTASPTPTPATCSGRRWPGMIWSKQFYYYDVPEWLKGDPAPAGRRRPSAGTAATPTGST